MTNRERQNAIFHYEPYDRLPVVHFGWWGELLHKWRDEGHLTTEEITHAYDGSEKDKAIGNKLGFDYNYYSCVSGNTGLLPGFERKVIKTLPDGGAHVLNSDGAIVLEKPGAVSIQAEIGHTLVDRESWEEHYLPRLQMEEARIPGEAHVKRLVEASKARTEPLGVHCGSMYGQIRNWMGVEGISYLYADDEELYGEIIDTVGNLLYTVTERALGFGIKFDFGHFWEDIAYKNGPLVAPAIFMKYCGPHYKRITDLLARNGIDIVSLDCDGMPDALIPTWLTNGVNTMFPIEVGTWGGSYAPWREQYGKAIRGVGGTDKRIFMQDRAAIDAEIERLRPIVELGGFIPCPDHRISPEAVWENVQYYTDRMHRVFG